MNNAFGALAPPGFFSINQTSGDLPLTKEFFPISKFPTPPKTNAPRRDWRHFGVGGSGGSGGGCGGRSVGGGGMIARKGRMLSPRRRVEQKEQKEQKEQQHDDDDDYGPGNYNCRASILTIEVEDNLDHIVAAKRKNTPQRPPRRTTQALKAPPSVGFATPPPAATQFSSFAAATSNSVVLNNPAPTMNTMKTAQAVRENKETVVQFLLALPGVPSSTPTTQPFPTHPSSTVRLKPLDTSGSLKLSGCLPLILPASHHIVLVDADADRVRSLSMVLHQTGYTVTALATLDEAATVVVENLVDLVICASPGHRPGNRPSNRCLALKRMMEEKMAVEIVQRPLPPVIKCMDRHMESTGTVSSRVDAPEMDARAVLKGATNPMMKEEEQEVGEDNKKNNNNNKNRFSKIIIRLPVETEPQKSKVVMAVAKALGIAKLLGSM